MIKVIFVLSTENNFVDFDEITERLGISEYKIRKKSDFPIQSVNAGLSVNEWSFNIKEECRAVSDMIDKIRDILDNKEDTIEDLCKKYGLNVTLTVVAEEEKYGYPEIFLTKENIKFLTGINAEIGFDIY